MYLDPKYLASILPDVDVIIRQIAHLTRDDLVSEQDKFFKSTFHDILSFKCLIFMLHSPFYFNSTFGTYTFF